MCAIRPPARFSPARAVHVRWRYRLRPLPGRPAADINALGVAAAEAVAEAILRAVKSARTLGGLPGLAG
jgi:L-aminopeptidase/D-esterase-like protein